ncbi:hypothetical protein [Methanimicrococcus hongohii]|uniref:hypothetical protein n=1 Tax=Methanimicrococcus hongohii TaxID=3028295 RepID=UPI00292FB995|nr:hypothetical protein [Methanimicrococcus sp. Hf6]
MCCCQSGFCFRVESDFCFRVESDFCFRVESGFCFRVESGFCLRRRCRQPQQLPSAAREPHKF